MHGKKTGKRQFDGSQRLTCMWGARKNVLDKMQVGCAGSPQREKGARRSTRCEYCVDVLAPKVMSGRNAPKKVFMLLRGKDCVDKFV